MARTKVLPDEPIKACPEEWIERLGALLKTLEAMDKDERAASLAYAKSRYRQDWPSDSYQ